jgi:hypothetical protein
LFKADGAGLRGAVGSQSGSVHADVSCQTAKEATGQKCPGNQPMQHAQPHGHDLKDDEGGEEKDSHPFVLLPQIGKSAFTHIAGYLDHPCRAGMLSFYLIKEDHGKDQRHDRAEGCQIPDQRYQFHFPYLFEISDLQGFTLPAVNISRFL